ncbi:hypothetical protein EVAR_18127_1 [Eumeta japonica]|uniref:Uncharacterized protein n=1 Tax=Eumeta variegata TaxID=151549 RepID=A0A4C1VIX6_EUMVA|nr:hypothetical protein EVAR_18127_1 [Eumeta japonica]
MSSRVSPPPEVTPLARAVAPIVLRGSALYTIELILGEFKHRLSYAAAPHDHHIPFHVVKMRYLLLLLLTAVVADGYRILVLFPVPSKSHSNLGFGLVRPLLDAGHENDPGARRRRSSRGIKLHVPSGRGAEQRLGSLRVLSGDSGYLYVTYVGPFLEKTTNKKLTQISVAEITSLIKDVNMVTKKDQGLSFVKEFSRNVTIMMMENKEVRAALLKNSYDAVITEWFFSDVHAGFAPVLQCPWILLSSTQVHPYLEYLMGEINSLGVYPNGIQDFPIPMNFWQRLINTAMAGLILGSVVAGSTIWLYGLQPRAPWVQGALG